MQILIIGYSRIVQKRVIPALLEIPSITRIDIASQSFASKIALPDKFQGDIYNDYDTALSKSKADLVYISTVNSDHSKWAEKALVRGFHVIVDKPAFTGFNTAERLSELAQKSGLCLSEATVYAFHPQIQAAGDIFLKARSSPTRLTVIFSFPPLSPGDFRYKVNLGGGALWDLGPYAVSAGRLFFGEEPEEIFCRICSWGGSDNIDTSFSMLASYPGGRAMVGHFGFDTGYQNYLSLLGPDVSVTVERVFTTPADMENEIHFKLCNTPGVIKAPKADSFSIYIQQVLGAVQGGNYKYLTENLLSDAVILHKLRCTALGKE
ncbi:MAG: Gfo/Idh/MocA family oxidoreductase [Candidatus Omnitrophica bacterium]|nr:Gfo/Idh/MocA family oxidoreductase [Candidatus Omnitrophota bacterium]